jgi:nitronate monooxygenase
MVGTDAQARQAIGWGADGLIAQGREAGGHIVGTMPALGFLPHARAAAGQRPVFLAGGIATAADTRAGAGRRSRWRRCRNAVPDDASGQCASRVSATNPRRRNHHGNHVVRSQLAASASCDPECSHSAVVPSDGAAKALPAALNASGRWLAVLGYFDRRAHPLTVTQAAGVHTAGTADRHAGFVVDHGALYAGDTALRINEIVSARQAVGDLAPSRLLHQGERESVPMLRPDRLEHCGIKLRVLTHNLQRPSRRAHLLVEIG